MQDAAEPVPRPSAGGPPTGGAGPVAAPESVRELDPPFGAHRPGPLVRGLIAAARAVPPMPGRVHLAHLARSIALAVARPPMDVACGPVRLRSDPTDNHCEKTFVFTPWRYDVTERRLLFGDLPPDGVFVDVGANVGLYALLAARSLGPGGRVIAIEPNPAALRRLRDNLAATGAADPRPEAARPRIDVVPVGVAEAEDELELHLEPGALGNSSLRAGGRAATAAATGPADGGTIRIRCRPLLALLRELGATPVHAMKLDVEGAEDRALVPFLAAAEDAELPRTIVLEDSSDAWAHDLPAALAGRGYALVARARLNLVYRRTDETARRADT